MSLPPSVGVKLSLHDTVLKAGRESFFLALSFIYNFLNRLPNDGGHLKGVEAAQSSGSQHNATSFYVTNPMMGHVILGFCMEMKQRAYSLKSTFILCIS